MYSLLLSSVETSQNAFFYSACYYLPQHGELYTTSKPLQTSDFSRLPVVLISKVKLNEPEPSVITSVEWTKLRPPKEMAMPSGAVAHGDGAIYCAQGSLVPRSGGIFYLARNKPPVPLVTNFYGREFNSPYGVTVLNNTLLCFTDPSFGHDNEFRNEPELPGQVYCLNPNTDELRVIANGFDRPTSIAFSHDESMAYIADTAAMRGDDPSDSSLYCCS
jgi:gluconolactonase